MTIGQIYAIVCQTTNLVYFGSTKQLLQNRLKGHISKPTKTSRRVLEHGRFFIVCIEEVNYENIRELRARERFCIKNLPCVNKNIPNNSQKESWDNWRKNNIEKERLRSRKFRQDNPDYHRLYRAAQKIK